MAALIALGGVLAIPASPAGAAEGDGSDVSTTRYGGPDRYATSLLIAEAFAVEAGGSLECAVLVSGQRWTDAVVAAPMAGVLSAPVLMTPPDEFEPACGSGRSKPPRPTSARLPPVTPSPYAERSTSARRPGPASDRPGRGSRPRPPDS